MEELQEPLQHFSRGTQVLRRIRQLSDLIGEIEKDVVEALRSTATTSTTSHPLLMAVNGFPSKPLWNSGGSNTGDDAAGGGGGGTGRSGGSGPNSARRRPGSKPRVVSSLPPSPTAARRSERRLPSVTNDRNSVHSASSGFRKEQSANSKSPPRGSTNNANVVIDMSGGANNNNNNNNSPNHISNTSFYYSSHHSTAPDATTPLGRIAAVLKTKMPLAVDDSSQPPCSIVGGKVAEATVWTGNTVASSSDAGAMGAPSPPTGGFLGGSGLAGEATNFGDSINLQENMCDLTSGYTSIADTVQSGRAGFLPSGEEDACNCNTSVIMGQSSGLLDVWREDASRAGKGKNQSFLEDLYASQQLGGPRLGGLMNSSLRRARTGDRLSHGSCLSKLVTTPASPKRICWDMLSAVAISYDCLTFPLGAFGYETVPGTGALALATTIFWTLDMIASFLCGFHRSDGYIELRLPPIAKRYLSTWFVLDLIVVGVEWFIIFFTDKPNDAVGASRVGKAVRTVRITRMLRMLRLVRIFKLKMVFEHITDVILTTPLVALANILKLLLGLAVVVHVFACGWYWVGTISIEESDYSWLTILFEQSAHPAYCYLVAYHWSIAQFTPAPNNFHPENWRERLYALLVLYVGLVLFSSLIGSTTALINQSKQHAYEKLRQEEMLRSYFRDNEISLGLWNRISHFFKESRKQHRRLSQVDLPLLKILPRSLQAEMCYEVYTPIVGRHRLFGRLEEQHATVMMLVCMEALVEKAYGKGEEPFLAGQEGRLMLFPIEGSLEYFQGRTSSIGIDHGESERTVERGRWIAEPSLWVFWIHRGLLLCQTSSLVILVENTKLGGVVRNYGSAAAMLREYAVLYWRALHRSSTRGEDIDDLFGLTAGDIVGSNFAIPGSRESIGSGKRRQTRVLRHL